VIEVSPKREKKGNFRRNKF
jgi:uncharacterized protein YdgA (DUF945 family)